MGPHDQCEFHTIFVFRGIALSQVLITIPTPGPLVKVVLVLLNFVFILYRLSAVGLTVQVFPSADLWLTV